MEYLTKGKRGLIFVDYVNGKKVVIKKGNPKSAAINRIENEIEFLNILNKYKIGPKLLLYNEDSFTMEFVEGRLFDDWLKENYDKKVVVKIMKQCYLLDKLKINKFELTNPVKHIIIKDNNPVMIDFERCKRTLSPKNVTQFVQFLRNRNLVKKEGLIQALKDYHNNSSINNFKKILNFLKP
ncbi:MAG TPA: hypothetical protein VJB94_03840 [Candidatus Nanoarchaeia archaeon]|nr:hypothetical protein [Candidatus Nanoarchaeia archaeon]